MADFSPAKKELLLLWTLLTANPKFNPAVPGATVDSILSGIVNEFRAASGPGSTWNFDALTPAAAKTIVHQAMSPMNNAEFNKVNVEFTSAFKALPLTDSDPWDPDLPDHPRVAEVKEAFGL